MTPRYLLDTNICIFLKKNRHPNVARKLAGLQPGDVAMSVVTWGELVLGAEKSRERSQTLAKITKLRTLVPVLDLSAAVGDRYGAIRGELESAGRTIGPNDLWIAAHAQTLGIALVTNNTGEFARVGGLTLEDWTMP
ncbi:MAG TPA: type II toxin-antitoxin system VapC family toxin [Accumulibacter sp.]|uniref:type II toxin-antitoxin system VapC family toxin n=1 Tax=Accumulibacter sp. TaxID=2053492 RepID=UPI000EBFCC26|nr:type II toxin-antitoxin system VapC family toxin [Accumulibacter sp.]HCZ17058.1 VapC toxin family PIN domain ribonuclease [Accumulibacter sp.]HRF72033.1 type II toxin-antitoxin system VapC family toxin [Accumulibacter sp.]